MPPSNVMIANCTFMLAAIITTSLPKRRGKLKYSSITPSTALTAYYNNRPIAAPVSDIRCFGKTGIDEAFDPETRAPQRNPTSLKHDGNSAGDDEVGASHFHMLK